MLRLYFNKRGDRPWSIDQGTDTPEQTFVEVFVAVIGTTRFDPSHLGSLAAPCAWLEFEDAKLRLHSSDRDRAAIVEA